MTDFARMRALANEICDLVQQKDADYGSSWRRRGGPGAYMVTVRKSDRIENLVSKSGYDVFAVLERNDGNIADDAKDLIGYMLLILEHTGHAPPTVQTISAAPRVKDGEDHDHSLDALVASVLELRKLPYDFPGAVRAFNAMFGLMMPPTPSMYTDGNVGALGRLNQFKEILQKELNEVDDVIRLVASGGDPLEVMTDLADWLGDMQVYCASEMMRWGIPWAPTLECIMKAQASKMGEDGKPIVKDGRVIKGPNYGPPEPAIRKMLVEHGMVSRMHPAGREAAHQDENFQCEGYYGDGTQLYRHRVDRDFMQRAGSLEEAYRLHAAWAAASRA